MPAYDLICRNLHIFEKAMSFADYDGGCFGKCGVCRALLFPVSANDFCLYGTDKFSDEAFSDASEAAGYRVTNTKEVDKLEREGKMYAVTNPSRYQHKNGKNIKRRKS